MKATEGVRKVAKDSSFLILSLTLHFYLSLCLSLLQQGQTALHVVCKFGQTDAVPILAERGVDLDALDQVSLHVKL